MDFLISDKLHHNSSYTTNNNNNNDINAYNIGKIFREAGISQLN